MDEFIGYVVACVNQASGQVEDTLASEILHFDLDDAEFARDIEADEAAENGRHDRYIVCEVTEVPDG